MVKKSKDVSKAIPIIIGILILVVVIIGVLYFTQQRGVVSTGEESPVSGELADEKDLSVARSEEVPVPEETGGAGSGGGGGGGATTTPPGTAELETTAAEGTPLGNCIDQVEEDAETCLAAGRSESECKVETDMAIGECIEKY